MPTPANAIFWGGLAFSYSGLLVQNYWVLIVLAVLFSYLLVAEIPMFALKVKNLAWKDNQIQYIFLLVTIILLVVFQLNAFAPIIGWYILLSVLTAIFLKSNDNAE